MSVPALVRYRGVLLPVLLTFAVLNALTVMTLAVQQKLTLACVFVALLGLTLAAFKVVRDYSA